MASRVQPGTALPGLTLEPQRGEPTRHGAPSSAPSASAPLPPVGPVGRTEHRPSRTELGGLEGAAAQAASLEIPTHSISTLRGSSRSVWSSNRWLEECKVGLKATESLCWSQLLQSFTGEPVKWAPKGPNKRQLSRKAVQGILAHQQSKHRGTSLAEDRKIKKEGSRDMALVDTEDKPEQASTTKSLKKGSTSISRVEPPDDSDARASMELVDIFTMQEMKKRMKAVLHKRIHSIRESVLKQRNETIAQKKYERLPQKEREALERAFFQYDADLSGFLEWNEVIPALRELGLSGSNAIEKREILQVCRNVITAAHVQSMHQTSIQSVSLQEVLIAQRNRQQNQPRIKLGVTKRAGDKQAPQQQSSTVAAESNKRTSTRTSIPSENVGNGGNGSRKSSLTSSAADKTSGSEGSDSEDFDTGVDMAPSEAKFDFLTFVGILVPKVRQRLTELQSTKIMRYFCNFDREGTGVVSVYKCIEIARCLRMDQLHMIDALKEQGFEEEPGVLVDFDSFERAVMSCRERTNRQLREREIDILTEMKVRPDLFEQCRDNIAQVYEIFRKFSGDAGSIGVVTANDAFLSVYELGMMPREGWQRDNIKSLLVPEDAEDIVYMQTELNFEEFLEFLRCVREYNDEQRLEELMERFQRLDKDRNGVLDMKELHALLEEAQCCPRTRKEQEEVQQLIQSVDADGNNVIDFDEFKELVQRIDEKFASLRYDSEVEYALARGFTETELGSFRAIFEHLDADNSGQLDMAEVRQCLSIMQHNSTWQAFEQTWILLDKDASGTLEFEEFIDFMRLMRDGEGVFAMDNGQKLPSHVKKLDERTLRSVLGHYGLSKSYLWALDKAQLMQRFCDCFGVAENSSLQDTLKVTTLNDLIKFAKEKGEELANLLM